MRLRRKKDRGLVHGPEIQAAFEKLVKSDRMVDHFFCADCLEPHIETLVAHNVGTALDMERMHELAVEQGRTITDAHAADLALRGAIASALSVGLMLGVQIESDRR